MLEASATRVYLLGDHRQRLYKWRGVKEDFQKAAAERDFFLTNSFRFGKNIGEVATRILKHADESSMVIGNAKDPGEVVREIEESENDGQNLARVVITRTNKGMADELLHRRKLLGRTPRWSLFKKGGKGLFKVAMYESFYAFFKKQKQTIQLLGETHGDWEEIEEAINT